MGRYKLTVPFTPIKPAAVLDFSEFGKAHDLPDLLTNVRLDRDPTKISAAISLLPCDILRVHALKAERRWLARTIELNPARLLWGHNGRSITTSAQLCEALTEALALISPLALDPDDALRFIPGLSEDGSWWNSIELPFNLSDPSGSYLDQFQNFTHPSIRKPGLPGTHGSLKLPGTQLTANVYRKDEEMKRLVGKFEAGGLNDHKILRVEFTLKGKKLRRYFHGAKHSTDWTVAPHDCPPLTSFSLEDLQRVHRMVASELQGVFHNPKGTGKGSSVARVIADLALHKVASAEYLIATSLRVNGGDRNTRSRLRRDVRVLLEEASSLSVDDVFSDENFANQPMIRIPKLENATKARWRRDGIHQGILAAYGSSSGPAPFVPMTSHLD